VLEVPPDFMVYTLSDLAHTRVSACQFVMAREGPKEQNGDADSIFRISNLRAIVPSPEEALASECSESNRLL
jgi:hypothetical protein